MVNVEISRVLHGATPVESMNRDRWLAAIKKALSLFDSTSDQQRSSLLYSWKAISSILDSDTDSAKVYLNTAYNLANEHDYNWGRAMASIVEARILKAEGELSLALQKLSRTETSLADQDIGIQNKYLPEIEMLRAQIYRSQGAYLSSLYSALKLRWMDAPGARHRHHVMMASVMPFGLGFEGFVGGVVLLALMVAGFLSVGFIRTRNPSSPTSRPWALTPRFLHNAVLDRRRDVDASFRVAPVRELTEAEATTRLARTVEVAIEPDAFGMHVRTLGELVEAIRFVAAGMGQDAVQAARDIAACIEDHPPFEDETDGALRIHLSGRGRMPEEGDWFLFPVRSLDAAPHPTVVCPTPEPLPDRLSTEAPQAAFGDDLRDAMGTVQHALLEHAASVDSSGRPAVVVYRGPAGFVADVVHPLRMPESAVEPYPPMDPEDAIAHAVNVAASVRRVVVTPANEGATQWVVQPVQDVPCHPERMKPGSGRGGSRDRGERGARSRGIDDAMDALVARIRELAPELSKSPEEDDRQYPVRDVIMIRASDDTGRAVVMQNMPIPPGAIWKARGQALDRAAAEASSAVLASTDADRVVTAYLCRRGEAWAWFQIQVDARDGNDSSAPGLSDDLDWSDLSSLGIDPPTE